MKEKLIIVLLLYSGRRNAAVPLNLQLQYRGRDISRVPADVVKIVLVINVYIYIVIFVSKKELNVIISEACIRSILESSFFCSRIFLS